MLRLLELMQLSSLQTGNVRNGATMNSGTRRNLKTRTCVQYYNVQQYIAHR